MSETTFATFDDFWAYYLNAHSHRSNRALHAAGTTTAATLLGLAALKRDWRYAALAPIVGYGSAWVGHLLVEKNKPATLTHPIWSLRADIKMAKLILTGGLERELFRLAIHEDVIDLYA